MTVAELDATMPYREFQEWQIYYGLHPSGEIAANLRTGHQMALFAAAHTGKNGKQPQPWEVFPLISKPAPPSPKQLVAQISQIFGRVVTEPDVLVPHERTE